MTALAGQVALITGSGRGIGAATAAMLAAQGATVVVNDLDQAACDQTVAQIKGQGGQAYGIALDLTADRAAETLLDFVFDACGGLDILINNAGYIWNGAIQNHSDEQWAAMLDMHATVPFRLLRAFYPRLKAMAAAEQAAGAVKCRKVINVSSVSATEGAPTQVAYSAGKAAVLGMTRTLAKEWGRFNVTVNCVAFGHIDTRLTQAYDEQPPSITVGDREHRVGLSQAQIAASTAQVPLGRVGQPEDAAGAIYLFCLPQANFVSGQILVCAGGQPG